MLAQKTRYALRALLFLVEEGRGAPVRAQAIAETQRIPRKYLELIMLDLKHAEGILAPGPLRTSAHDIHAGSVQASL